MATSGGGCTVWPHLEEGVQYGHIRRRVYTVWPHLEEGSRLCRSSLCRSRLCRSRSRRCTDKTSQGQNVSGTKRPKEKMSLGSKRPKGQNVLYTN